MKLPQVIYNNPVETMGRYGSRAPQIIEKTGQVIGQGIENAGRIEADGIRRSGTILGSAIADAGRTLARGTLAAEVMKNNAIYGREAKLKQLDIQADLRMNEALVGAASSLFQAGIQVWGDYVEDERKQQSFEASAAISETMNSHHEKWLQMGNYPSMNMPEGYKGLRKEGVYVPMSQALPELYRDAAHKAIDQHAELIQGGSARKKFIAEAKQVADKKYFEMAEDALKEARKENVAYQQQVFENLLDSGRFREALDANEVGSFVPAVKAENKFKVHNKVELGQIATAIMSGNIELIEEQVDRLNAEDYLEDKRNTLDPVERLAQVNKLEAKLDDILDQTEGQLAATKQRTRANVDAYIKLASAGHPIDVKAASQVLLLGEQLEVNPVKLDELRYALKVWPKVHELNKSPLPKRQAIVASFKNSAQGPHEQLFAMEVEKQAFEIDRALLEDPLGHAVRSGVVPEPLPFDPVDANSPAFWHDREQARRMAEYHYGVPTGYLGKDEAKLLSRYFDESDPNTQAAMLQLWHSRLGEDNIGDLLDQLGQEVPTMPLLANMDYGTATRALKGRKVRKENPDMVPARNDMMPIYDKVLGNFATGDAKMRAAAEEMITDLYLAEAERAGWFDAGVINKPKSFTDIKFGPGQVLPVRRLLGLINYDGQTIMAPEQGQTEEQFNAWILNSSPQALIQDRALGLSNVEVMDGIHKGAFKMQQIGRQEFILFDTETGVYVPDKTNGQPLIIKYNTASTPTIEMEIDMIRQAIREEEAGTVRKGDWTMTGTEPLEKAADVAGDVAGAVGKGAKAVGGKAKDVWLESAAGQAYQSEKEGK